MIFYNQNISQKIIMPFDAALLSKLSSFYIWPTMFGIYITVFIFLTFSTLIHYFPKSVFSVVFELVYEKGYSFFEEIMGKKYKNIIPYVVSLFFLLLCINLLGVVWDFVAPIFWITDAWTFALSNFYQTPSADLTFNLAVAIVSILLLIGLQFSYMGSKKSLYSYFPIYGKGYLSFKPKKWSLLSYAAFPLVKAFDIVLSMFLALLDIVGLWAKIVSLSFRLFWNIASGGVLLVLLVGAMSDMTQRMTGFMWGINFPIIFPLLLYAQSALVACIQAMVFALLVAIFIRVSQLEAS